MDSTRGTWLVTQEADTARAVAGAVGSHDRLSPVRQCRNLDELMNRFEQEPSPVVLVDIDPDPTQMLAGLRPIIDGLGHTRFVVLAGNQDADSVMEAMHVGARHYCVKSSLTSDLTPALQRLIVNGSVQPRQRAGTVVTVLSAGGGCGATTLAVNLAAEVQTLLNESTLLVDLDTQYGAVASYLGANGQYGVADVLARRGEIDPDMIRTTAVAHSNRVDVLLSPASIDFSHPAALRYERLTEFTEACSSAYGCTVIDAPSVSIQVAARLAKTSNLTLIVLQLTVKDVRNARAVLESLTGDGIPPHQLMLVVNRYRRWGEVISIQEAQRALHGVEPRRIRNDFRSATRGINFGQFLDEVAPRSPLRRDVRDLAVDITKARIRGIKMSTAQ